MVERTKTRELRVQRCDIRGQVMAARPPPGMGAACSLALALGLASTVVGLSVVGGRCPRLMPPHVRLPARGLALQLRGGGDADGGGSPALTWSSVSLTVDGRQILEDISGEARAGRLLAIMGPSGAGKTSLLHVLGGMLQARQGQVLRGSMSGPVASLAHDHSAAFVGQNDNFHSHLSVEETLLLAANLRLPGSTRAQRREAVDATLRQLHLTHVRCTLVGNDRSRGISGGERRRLALGCELMGSPRVVFADEPTSGLDAFQAERMMLVLRKIAAQGCTVIVTIHQPSSKVWRMLDDVMLLSGGRTVYVGHRLTCLPSLAALGYRCPPETNPAEFVLDVISVDASSPKSERQCEQRVAALVKSWACRASSPGKLPMLKLAGTTPRAKRSAFNPQPSTRP
jgi:ABC-type multidrug transport system ATPase subunit